MKRLKEPFKVLYRRRVYGVQVTSAYVYLNASYLDLTLGISVCMSVNGYAFIADFFTALSFKRQNIYKVHT